ncbi:hypothetical protein CANMA_000828 [Candida margitis]|uniref:uncharacterized protein n=1 Tax=Candida margitis TaxID=1775924 RepID=UPI00222642E0|nr:uncharacterized protein CANMA_000828 [Candida margitis]KAI5970216.1 hypothetical protein CANMA_000828 [Candida margitis]
MSTDYWTGIQQIVNDTYLPYTPFSSSSSLIKIAFSQCVTLLFMLRFFTPKISKKHSLITHSNTSRILFEMALCIANNVGSLSIIASAADSRYFTIDLKYALAIQVIIIYVLFILDVFVFDTNGVQRNKQEEEDSVALSEEEIWYKYLRNLNNDFLKIILSYNFIMITSLDEGLTVKLVDFGIKLYCLWIMLRYEFKKEEEKEMVSDTSEKV